MQTDQPKRRLELLQDLLVEQLSVYYHLFNLAQKERNALIESKFELLNDVITEKTGLVQVLESLERSRMELMVDLSVRLNLDSKNITLIHLADLVDQTTSERLLHLRKELTIIVRKLQKENDVNKRLMVHSINLMDNSINMLNSLGYREPTYIHTGQFVKVEEGGGLFSSKV
jgi:flagellar biosynthesis/type III secretory pathway chaperone